jgi:hypothetical protein
MDSRLVHLVAEHAVRRAMRKFMEDYERETMQALVSGEPDRWLRGFGVARATEPDRELLALGRGRRVSLHGRRQR